LWDIVLLSFNCRSIARTCYWQLVLNHGHWLAVPGWHVSNFFPRSPLPEFVVPFSSRMYLLEPCRVGLVSNELAKFFLDSLLEACSARVRPFGLVAAVTTPGGARLVPSSSCGMAVGLLFVARCQWPRAGQPCLLAPHVLLHCRLWSRRVRTVPCPGQLWPPAYHVAGLLLCRSARLRAGPSRCHGHRCGVNTSPPALCSLVPTGCRACSTSLASEHHNG
jgi:hypothetical protein